MHEPRGAVSGPGDPSGPAGSGALARVPRARLELAMDPPLPRDTAGPIQSVLWGDGMGEPSSAPSVPPADGSLGPFGAAGPDARVAPRTPHPLAVFTSAWRHRDVVARLAAREVLARYRGSLLGILWSFLNPLLLLAAFTFVFSVVFESRWDVSTGGRADFALVLFAGLVVYWCFSDCAGRAPDLVLENAALVKRVVFPLEVLPWVVLLAALFHACVGVGVLLAARLALGGGAPPPTALLFPLVLAPVALLSLGCSWFLASLGVYVRDVRQVVPVGLTLLLFLSPIFYPLEAVPDGMRTAVALNPLALLVEQMRGVLLFGRVPDPAALLAVTLSGWGVAWLGLVWFTRTRRGFADVL